MAVTLTQRGALLHAPTQAQYDEFAYSAALSADGEVLAVGVPGNDSVSSNNGIVYVFDRNGTGWTARGSALQCPDATAGNRFGHSVSFSADGEVLAVGAPNHGSNAGIVYVFDRNGTGWTLRGSGLTGPTDPSAPVKFGTGVSLSEAGDALAVCSPEQPDSGIHATYKLGVVYVYDRNGSGWTQRGSKLMHPSAAGASGDLWWAVSVAFSRDGTVMAVGSDEVGTGRLYVYDRNGSGWTLRGGSFLATPQPYRSYWGAHLALSDDGTWLASTTVNWGSAISLHVMRWDGTYWVEESAKAMPGGYPQYGSGVAMSAYADVMTMGDAAVDGSVQSAGGLYVFDTDIPPPMAASDVEAPTALTIGTAGDVEAPTRLAVGVTGDVEGPTILSSSYPTGDVEAPTALAVRALGDVLAPTELAIVPAAHAPNWTARCTIDGVDVSSRLNGVATVRADEGAARVATITLLPQSGVVAPLDYVGRTIALDYVLLVAGVPVARRIFTGRVDTPVYDPNTTLLTLDCTDDLQNRVAALERAAIDTLTGGRYTAAVQGVIEDNWDYAQARMSTVQASLDAGPYGGMRVTPWRIASTWATYGVDKLLYERMLVSLPQRSTLVNKVDVEFDYRYARLRQRQASVGWSGTHIDMRGTGYFYPRQQDVEGACNGTGWTVVFGAYSPAPAAIPLTHEGQTVFHRPEPGSIDMAIMRMAQRHAQGVTEQYRITVHAPESIAANGTLPHAMRGALESSFDGRAWESAFDVPPLMSSVLPSLTIPGDGEMDYAPDATRSDADYAIQTMLDQAAAKITGSHRSARVGNAVICDPGLDLDKWIVIDTPDCQAAGKVAELSHVLDFAAGSALTEFSLAISGVGGAGIIVPDTLAPPAPPPEAAATHAYGAEMPDLFVHLYGRNVYAESAMGLLLNPPKTITCETAGGDVVTVPNAEYVSGSYPVQGFRAQMPGVIDADRNPIEKPVASVYQIVVPEDTLTFTVP